jgi:hypothetical protein
MSPAAANPAFTSNIQRAFPMPRRLIVGDRSPFWWDAATERLQDLVLLDRGWDGYRAPPVSFEIAHFTLDMLRAVCPTDMPSPQLIPGTSGDLQVEWHYPTGEIELHVRAPNSVSAWRRSASVPDGEEVTLTNDFVVVLGWIREMLGDPSGTLTAAA